MERDDSNYIFIVSLVVCHAMVVTLNYEFFSKYILLQRLSIVTGYALLFPNIRVVLDEKYRNFNILVVLSAASMLISAYVNRNRFTCSIWVDVMLAIRILLFAWYIEYLDLTGNTIYGIRCLFIVILGYCIVSDALAIVSPRRTYNSWGGYSDDFLVGQKFTLSYLHLMCLAVYCALIQDNFAENRNKVILLAALSLFAAYYSECSTMVVGTAAIGLMMIFKDKIVGLLQKPAFYLAYLAVCDTVLLAGRAVLQIPAIKYVIEEVLHESTDLTGRGGIYDKIGSILNLSPLFGVGLNNNNMVSVEYVEAADVQNGILDVFLSFGWVGVVILIGLMLYALYRSRLDDQPVLLFTLYIYVTLSSVEITFREEFYVTMMLIVLFSWCGRKEEKPEEKSEEKPEEKSEEKPEEKTEEVTGEKMAEALWPVLQEEGALS